jgi:replication factor A1
MTSINDIVSAIEAQLTDHIDVESAEIRKQVNTLREYSVPAEEIQRVVIQNTLEGTDVDQSDVFGENSSEDEVVPLSDVSEHGDGAWLDTVEVEFVDKWDPSSESIGQVGLLADGSGTIKFISWATSDVAALEEGQTYRIGPVAVDEYEGRYSIQLNSETDVVEIDDSAVDSSYEDGGRAIEGALMNVQNGSGLIKRCPDEDCTRVLRNGRCAEHGEVEGEFDLRIKATLDDGHEAESVLFDEEMTTELTGISLEEAKNLAMDALDTSVVAQAIEDEIVGTYVELRGSTYGNYFIVNEIGEPGPVELEALAAGAVEMSPDAEAGSQSDMPAETAD